MANGQRKRRHGRFFDNHGLLLVYLVQILVQVAVIFLLALLLELRLATRHLAVVVLQVEVLGQGIRIERIVDDPLLIDELGARARPSSAQCTNFIGKVSRA